MNEKEYRELDVFIASNVFGMHDFCTSHISGELIALKSGDKRPRSGNTSNHHLVPTYTTNASDAMAVLKKCAEKYWAGIQLIKNEKGWHVKTLFIGHEASSETLELTICKFAKNLFKK